MVFEMNSKLSLGLPLVLLAAAAGFAAEDPLGQITTIESRLDSIPDYITSTVIGKDDKPISAAGDVAVRMKNFHYDEPGAFQEYDRGRTIVDAVLNGWITATPNSTVNLWTNFTLPFDFSGYFSNRLATHPNNEPYNHSERVQFGHGADYYGPYMAENLTAGIDVRGGGFGGMFRAGGVLWASSSPLTMWERETNPRFPSQYELFEEEKTVSTYYKEKTFRPVKEGGRAFWTNRSFGGLMFDIYALPGDFTAQFLLSQPADMDKGTRDGLRMLGSQIGEVELAGNMDERGVVYAGRVAKQKLFNDVSLGLNYLGVQFQRDLVYEPEYIASFNGADPILVDNHIASTDIKGDILPNLFLLLDVAVSFDDSTKFRRIAETATVNPGELDQDLYKSKKSSPEVGIYAKLQSKHWEPITFEAIYLPKNFFSPYGMTDNSRFRSWRKDEFYLGAGTFRYGPNMVGGNLKFEPVFNRGRFDMQYGVHKQLEKGTDVLLFNYKLNGRAMWEGTNSWTKHKPLFNLDSGTATGGNYRARTGVLASGPVPKFYRQQGGVYGGTWETWESFVAYESVGQVQDSVIPQHVKWATTLTMDGGYDISHWFNTDRNIMLSAYGALYGISTSFSPMAYSEKQEDMLLWSLYVQSEPAIAITPTLHALLVLGFETFRSEQAYTQVTNGSTLSNEMGEFNISGGASPSYFVYCPINYLETAIGFGFDWDFAPRAGLHVRYKRATHTDENLSENDWKAHIVQAETKFWF